MIGSYFLASEKTSAPNLDPTAAVVAGPAPEREPIEVRDSDNDGIPDWKEEFGYTHPIEITQQVPETESYTIPDTLTNRLAIDLLTSTVHAQGYGPFGPTQEQIIGSAAVEIGAAGEDTLYTRSNIEIVQNNSLDALRAYGNKVAEIALVNSIPAETRHEIEIFQSALYSEDQSLLAELDPIIASYSNMKDGMLLMSVPSSMSPFHLDLLNTYNAILADIQAMQNVDNDPLYTMVRMKRYFDDVQGMSNAIANLYAALYQSGVRWTTDDIATDFVTIEAE